MNETENNTKREKKLYHKWWIWVIGLIALIFIFRIGSSTIEKAMTKDIPNVMGVNYIDAESILKENGFKVSSVETDASSILSNDTHNRSVKKDEVFKINNETSPNYNYGRTKDKKITIYYAKDDYTYNKPVASTTPAPTAKSVDSNETASTSNTSSNWKQFLKDYEGWVDSYITFMEKYKENPSDTALIAEYGKFMADTADWATKAQKYEDDLKEMSPDDVAEYTKTMARIIGKLSDIAK
ncbi:hypothetical protein FMM68_09010 [Lachnospiraceae bacterium MD329]|nr:hypothetical protein [Lachnospiraceae bacterium MD329]